VLVLFDIDDTLIDHASAFHLATVTLHRRVNSLMPVEDFAAQWSAAHRHYFDRYLAGELTYEQQSRARIRTVVDPGLRDDAADQLFTAYITSYEAAWSLFPDVAPCLDGLNRHQLGVISNGQRSQQVRKLERTGIIDRFGCIVISEDCGRAKPDAEIFRRACALIGESPGRTLYVGDSYDLDAMGARRAGLVGVWLDRAGSASSVHVPPVVRSLRELPHVVDSMAT
jgi:putative hydrolase of the HAD superfamily